MAIATDRNPGTSPGLSLLLMLNMACTLFRLTPEEALARRHRATRRARSASPTAARSPPASAPTSWSGTLRARQRAGLLRMAPTPAGASSPAAANEADDQPSTTCTAAARPLLVSMPHVGTRIPDDLRPRYVPRALGVEDTDWHLDRLYDFAARARRQPARAAPFALRDRPEPAARRRADVPRREQHRAVPDALLHRRAAVPRRHGAGRRRESRAAARPTGARTTTRSQAELDRLRDAHGHAVLFDGHSIQSRAALAVRRPAARPQPRHRRRRELRAVAARRRWPACSPRRTATAMSSTAASRAATSRATTAAPPTRVHAVQLEMCWPCYIADESDPARWNPTDGDGVRPLLRRLLETMAAWRP